MLARKVFFADAFFGTMTAGTTSLETIGAFLAAMPDFRLAEIGLHPGAMPDATAAGPADGWHDPLAQLRPRELEMLVSVENGRTACRLRLPLGQAQHGLFVNCRVRGANRRENGGLRTDPDP